MVLLCAGFQRHLQEELDEVEELCDGDVSSRYDGSAKRIRGDVYFLAGYVS